MFVSAVIVAAGKGARMNAGKNKIFLNLGGRPILAWTIDIFEKCNEVDEIVLVANDNEMDFCRSELIKRYGFKKVKTITAGGSERQNSVFNGLKEVDKKCDVVLIHDAARPFTGYDSVIGSIAAAQNYGAAAVAVPVKDTIKLCDESGFVKDTPDRKNLWAIQTPQAFRFSLIMEAHRKALEEGFVGTDDAVLVERLGYDMKLVLGDYWNIKLTTPEDMVFGEAILNSRNLIKRGNN